MSGHMLGHGWWGGGGELEKHISWRRTDVSTDPTQGPGAASCPPRPTHDIGHPPWMLDCFSFVFAVLFLSLAENNLKNCLLALSVSK